MTGLAEVKRDQRHIGVALAISLFFGVAAGAQTDLPTRLLVMDHLGHGERRQHPFRSAADFVRPYQVSRQDYYFAAAAQFSLGTDRASCVQWLSNLKAGQAR